MDHKVPNGYCEIIIHHTRNMPPTSLWWLEQKLLKEAETWTPKLTVRKELEKE